MPRWTRVIGDGIAYEGSCLLLGIILWPDTAADYTDIYDGRDATSGKKFCRIEADVDRTRPLNFGRGVPFDTGIYIDGMDSAVETTVIFEPLPE